MQHLKLQQGYLLQFDVDAAAAACSLLLQRWLVVQQWVVGCCAHTVLQIACIMAGCALSWCGVDSLGIRVQCQPDRSMPQLRLT